jgi:glycosyltransferase involved in cell wall biosynthesis
MRVLLPALVRHAAHVFTVSEFSRSRLVELVGVPEDRVSITYNGVRAGEGVAPSAGELEAMNLTPTSRFFLVVGSLEPRKNLAGLLKAFSAWAGAADVELVIVGDVGSSRVFADSPAVRNTPGVRLLGRVSDTQLSSLYRTALACVFVPLYEGFGLPPVEALAHGCRVIASDIPPLHEACGSLATFVDPRSRSEIVAAFDQVLTSSPPAGDLLRAHLSKFDWKVTADAVAARMEQL